MKRLVLLLMVFYGIINTSYADNITSNVDNSEAIGVLLGTDYNGINFQGSWFSNKPSVPDVISPSGATQSVKCVVSGSSVASVSSSGLQDGDTFTEAGITYQVISASEKTAKLKRGADVSGVVNIPNEVNGFTVSTIGKAAFRELRNITAVTIPNSVITMERSVFDDCSSLTSVSIPGSVTSIGLSPFTGCKKLTSVTVANDNPVYDSRNNCNAIIETATNKLIVGSIASVIPGSVVTIATRAFEDIRGMVSVVIPEGVTSIEEMAFFDCSDLKEVTLPSSLTSISVDAFCECPSITKVTSLITTPFAIDKWTFGIEDTNYPGYFNPVVYNTATLYVPAGTSTLYQATDGWSLFANIEEIDLTGFEDIVPFVTEPFDIYDLSGCKVRHQVISLDGLPNGIYIVNNKKVLKNY